MENVTWQAPKGYRMYHIVFAKVQMSFVIMRHNYTIFCAANFLQWTVVSTFLNVIFQEKYAGIVRIISAAKMFSQRLDLVGW